MSEAENVLASDEVVENVAEKSGQGEREVEAQSELVTEIDPESVKRRLNKQAAKHRREMADLKRQLMDLQQKGNQGMQDQQQAPMEQMQQQASGQGQMSDQDRIRQMIGEAMKAQEQQKAQQALQEQYMKLKSELDKGSEKYEDFEEVVYGDAPFTDTVRDSLLLVPNASEVAYALAKDRKKLMELSKLSPVEQAREVTNLAFGLASADKMKESSNEKGTIMNQLRPNPAKAVPGGLNPADPNYVSNLRRQLRDKTRR